MNKYLQTLTCHQWRNKMSDQELSQVKNITLDYLEKIGATLEEHDGLYTIEIPTNFEATFGGKQKRITFDSEVAETHSCELVIYGSNFLAIILDKIKQQAPVISGHLKTQGEFPIDVLDTIPVYRGTVNLEKSENMEKTVLRFYFNVNLKSVKNESTLQWIDVDSETLKKVEFPEELNLEPSKTEISFDKKSIDACYGKAVKILQKDITPIVDTYTVQTTGDLNEDLHLLDSSFKKRVTEIKQNITNQKHKLREWDNKIHNAKKYATRNKYLKQKAQAQNKIHNEEIESVTQIDKLKHDKEIQQQQITKRYTTKVTSTLVASQVFSYSITRCTLKVKNQHSQNKTIGEYLEHSQEFVIPCNVCNVNSKEIHLCVNGHVGCDLCSNQCVTCENDFCQKCNYQLNSCHICKEKNCNDCSSRCTFCQELVCTKHEMSCSICEKNYCSNHTEKCKLCEQLYSSGCVKNNQCHTCDELVSVETNDSKVLEVILINSDLGKYKKWECATNSKFSVFRAKKMLGKKIIVFDKIQEKIIVDKKGGWL